jgi:transposase
MEIKRSKGITRGKTDKADSKEIVLYALTHQHKLKLGSLPDETLQEIRLLYTEREKLIKAIQLFERTTENIGYLPKKLLTDLLKNNASTIRKLKTNLKKLDKKIQELLSQNGDLKEKDRLIQSIPGVGPQTSIYLLLVTRGFSSFENSRQLACYGGVAPFEYSSGSSVRGRTKVSNLADKKLKSLLNMCALNAKAWDYELKQYYDRKVKEGKPKMLILNNIRNKILGRVFAVINRGTPYVNTRKFAA